MESLPGDGGSSFAMAAGPISERNQGDWGERARNGLRGSGGWTVATSVSAGAGAWASPGTRDPPGARWGRGEAGFGPRPVGAMLSMPNLLPSR